MSWCPSSRAHWLGFRPRLLRMRRRSAAPAQDKQALQLVQDRVCADKFSQESSPLLCKATQVCDRNMTGLMYCKET